MRKAVSPPAEMSLALRSRLWSVLLTAIADPTFPHLPHHHSRHLPASLTLLVYEINIWLITYAVSLLQHLIPYMTNAKMCGVK